MLVEPGFFGNIRSREGGFRVGRVCGSAPNPEFSTIKATTPKAQKPKTLKPRVKVLDCVSFRFRLADVLLRFLVF